MSAAAGLQCVWCGRNLPDVRGQRLVLSWPDELESGKGRVGSFNLCSLCIKPFCDEMKRRGLHVREAFGN